MTTKVRNEFILSLHSKVGSGLKKEIENELPELFRLEVGKWYKSGGSNGDSLFNYQTGDGVYGFMKKQGQWKWERCSDGRWSWDDTPCTPAADEEVESALINEAKIRGLWDNKNIVCAYSNKTVPGTKTTYYNNRLWGQYGCIFDNGKWAEILEEPAA